MSAEYCRGSITIMKLFEQNGSQEIGYHFL